MSLKVWCISDTHGFHEDLKIPNELDMVIFSGDMSNHREIGVNSNECTLFLNWYDKLDVKYKVLVAGNHDTSIEAKVVRPRNFKSLIYLEHESVDVLGLNIFGSPYTPTYGQSWAFLRKREKLNDYWKVIPDHTDIVVTHGPPKGILDLSENKEGQLEQCGDKALYNHMLRVQPMYHVFGHIHNRGTCRNQGKTVHNETVFINASCVEDNKKSLTSNGVVITI